MDQKILLNIIFESIFDCILLYIVIVYCILCIIVLVYCIPVMFCCFRILRKKIQDQNDIIQDQNDTIQDQNDIIQDQNDIIQEYKIKEQNKIIERVVNIKTDPKYYRLINNISNFRELSNEDKLFIKTLSKQNLLELIDIYNTHMQNINEWLNMYNGVIQ